MVQHTTLSTQTYALKNVQNFMEYDLSWDGIDRAFMRKVRRRLRAARRVKKMCSRLIRRVERAPPHRPMETTTSQLVELMLNPSTLPGTCTAAAAVLTKLLSAVPSPSVRSFGFRVVHEVILVRQRGRQLQRSAAATLTASLGVGRGGHAHSQSTTDSAYSKIVDRLIATSEAKAQLSILQLLQAIMRTGAGTQMDELRTHLDTAAMRKTLFVRCRSDAVMLAPTRVFSR